MHLVRIFISHSFSDIHHEAGLGPFREAMSALLEDARAKLSSSLRDQVALDTFFDSRSYGAELTPIILERLKCADILIADITGGKENVLYELGFAHACGAQLILLQNSAFEAEAKRQMSEMLAKSRNRKPDDALRYFVEQYVDRPSIPTGLSPLLIGRYSSFEQIKEAVRDRFRDILAQIALGVKRGVLDHKPGCFWFPERTKTVHVVCSFEPESTRGLFANKSSDNFISIDNLEDRDSIMELGMFLSRSFPASEICIHGADNIGTNLDRECLVIVGGPLNNGQARQFMRRLQIPIDYHIGDPFERVDFRPTDGAPVSIAISRDEAGLITRDVGYFGWFRNPLKQDNRIVLVQGYQTWGTLASTRLFAGTSRGRINRSYLMGLLHRQAVYDLNMIASLQAFFPVDVMEDRCAETPTLGDKAATLSIGLD